MEFKTSYNLGDTVHFMFDNKAVSGKIVFFWTQVSFNDKKEVQIKTTYKVNHKWTVDVDKSGGFAVSQNGEREKTFDLDESVIFASKEDLLKSL